MAGIVVSGQPRGGSGQFGASPTQRHDIPRTLRITTTQPTSTISARPGKCLVTGAGYVAPTTAGNQFHADVALAG